MIIIQRRLFIVNKEALPLKETDGRPDQQRRLRRTREPSRVRGVREAGAGKIEKIITRDRRSGLRPKAGPVPPP